jgi:hypothetical protein
LTKATAPVPASGCEPLGLATPGACAVAGALDAEGAAADFGEVGDDGVGVARAVLGVVLATAPAGLLVVA